MTSHSRAEPALSYKARQHVTCEKSRCPERETRPRKSKLGGVERLKEKAAFFFLSGEDEFSEWTNGCVGIEPNWRIGALDKT